jgi:nonsense-mediated mRNA decay protein 3
MAAMDAAAGTPGTVLCCLCGCNIPPNPANMCASCIRSQARGARRRGARRP